MRAERYSVTAAGAAAGRVFRRFALGDLDRVAAATRRNRVRIVDREPGGLDGIDVVDLRTLEIRRAEWVDDDGDPVLLELEVALGCGAVEAEPVLEARATTALNRDAQHTDIRFLGHQLLDLHGASLDHRERRRPGRALLNLHLRLIVETYSHVPRTGTL